MQKGGRKKRSEVTAGGAVLHASERTCKFVQGPNTLSQLQPHHGIKPRRQLLSFLRYLQWCNEKPQGEHIKNIYIMNYKK